MSHTIQVIGSQCLRTIGYGEMVERALMKNGLEGEYSLSVSQVDGEGLCDGINLREKYSLSNRCSNAYCPGCNYLNLSDSDSMYMPALIIDDEVVLHSCFPTEKELAEILLERR